MITQYDKTKYLPKPAKRLQPTLIDKADESVDIRDIMRAMGLWAPEGTFYSYKIFCPWAEEHGDGGLDKNCRLFGSTNIYCWDSHGYISPTILYARWKGVPRGRAAEILLEERGLLHKNWRETWDELVALREAHEHGRLGSKQELVATVHEALKNNEVYLLHEFDTEVRSVWSEALEWLDELWEKPSTNVDTLLSWVHNVEKTRSEMSLELENG